MTRIPMPLDLTSKVVCAYVAHNPLPIKDVETLLRAVHHAFSSLAAGKTEPSPAITIRASVTPDHIVCLEDGKRLKMLKRYLRSHYGLTPEGYRATWNLPSDYPMTAPNYAARRSSF
jgi:predicted transcriptional regulator